MPLYNVLHLVGTVLTLTSTVHTNAHISTAEVK